MKWWFVLLVVISTLMGTTGCENEPTSSPTLTIAENIFAPQGAVLPQPAPAGSSDPAATAATVAGAGEPPPDS